MKGPDVRNDNEVPRPVAFADFLVTLAGLLNKMVRAFEAFTDELMDLAIYNANRESKVNKAWQEFSNDLEKLQEDNDGA